MKHIRKGKIKIPWYINYAIAGIIAWQLGTSSGLLFKQKLEKAFQKGLETKVESVEANDVNLVVDELNDFEVNDVSADYNKPKVSEVNDVDELSEDYIINYTAERVGVDVNLLKAIRKAENGGKGIEFGIIPTKKYENDKGIVENGEFRKYKNDFEKQASWCAWTIKRNLKRFDKSNYDGDFISFLQEKYCPIGVENDPDGLNKNWEDNVKDFYEEFTKN